MSKQTNLSGPRSGGGVTFCGCLVSTTLIAFACALTAQAVEGPADKAKVADRYGKLPMSFEVNQGQAAGPVKFLSRGSGYGLFLTEQGAVLTLRRPTVVKSMAHAPRINAFGIALKSEIAAQRPYREGSTQPDRIENRDATDVIEMQLLGANRRSEPVGKDRLPGTSNYFIGNDPAHWRTNLANFSRVSYAGVYPGVDLVYYGNQRQLEYDFVVAARADPNSIRIHFDGAQSLQVDRDGNLSINAKNGSVGFDKPKVYQTVNGVHRAIAGRFLLLAGNRVGFSIGRYDRSKPLVIDPVLSYSTYFGGSNAEFAVAVAADSSGYAYVTGLTISEDFPLTSGAYQAVNYASGANAVSTAFVSKFDPSGTALLYSTYLGGVAIPNTLHEQGDYGKAIAVDGSGDAYVTGYTYSSDFPITGGAFQTVDQAADIELATGFVTKLNPSGTGLAYSTFLGGDLLDEPTAIALDAAGDAYISGLTFSANFPVTSGSFQVVNKSAATNGFNDFVAKLNPTGSGLIYSTYLGGASSDGSSLGGYYWTNPIAVDSSGNAYVEGFTDSGDFPVSPNAYQRTNTGGFAVTVSKLNATGSGLLYSTYLGGSGDAIGEGLAIDNAGNAYVAGFTDSTDFPVTSAAFQTVNKADTNTSSSSESNENGFVTKINPTGTALVYSTYLGGTTGPWGGDQIYDLALDSAGDVFVAGSAMSADFPVTSGAYQSKNNGATHCCDYSTYTSNGFLTEFNPEGKALIYSTYLGGSGTQNPVGPGGSGDAAYGLTLGPNGNVYLVGFTSSSNFPVTAGAFETTYHTQQNTGFVADLDLGAAPTSKGTATTLTASANPVVPGTSVTFTAAVTLATGAAVTTGSAVFTVDEATVATVALSSAGKATYSTSALVAGEHYVLASYVGSATYNSSGDGLNESVTPVKPVITPAGGTYMSQQTATISGATSGSVIYYTVDGTTPTVFSSQYSGPIVVNRSKTLNAIAVSEHDSTSAEATAAYQIVGSPSVLAAPATAVGVTGATLNAFVNTMGLAGSYYYRYGPSIGTLGSSTGKMSLSASTTRAQAVGQLTTLASKSTYYYQVVVSTAGGTTTSEILSFTTN